MGGPGDQADQVRDDEPDERDDAGRRDRGAGRERERDDEQRRTRSVSTPRCAASRSPSVSRSSVAGVPERAAAPTTTNGAVDGDERPGGAAEAAERPEDDVAQLRRRRRGRSGTRSRRRDRGDGDAGQDSVTVSVRPS